MRLRDAFGPHVAFDGEPAAGNPPADQQTAPPPQTPPAATPPAAGPWAEDLAQYIEDEAARAQADRYLREKIQPRMTQLEQAQSEYAPAREFMDDLREDPTATTVALITELYGDEVGKQTAELIQAGLNPAAAAEAATQNPPPPPPADPVVDQMKAEYEEKQREKLFNKELERVKATPNAQGVEIDRDLFAVFVSMAEGDFDNALVGYKQFEAQARQRYGPTQPGEDDPDPPPAVLGTQPGGAPASTPPVVKDYKGDLGAALDDFLTDLRATREGPTVVGTV
jgi:hypothetical protein